MDEAIVITIPAGTLRSIWNILDGESIGFIFAISRTCEEGFDGLACRGDRSIATGRALVALGLCTEFSGEDWNPPEPGPDPVEGPGFALTVLGRRVHDQATEDELDDET